MTPRIEWDPAKAVSNLRKHGVSFETAKLVFHDPFALTFIERIEQRELRWLTGRMVGSTKLLSVELTEREEEENGNTVEIIRMISARKAVPAEKRRYEHEAR